METFQSGWGNWASLRCFPTWTLNIREDNLKRGDGERYRERNFPSPNQHSSSLQFLSWQVPLTLPLFTAPQSCQELDVQPSPGFQEALLDFQFPAENTPGLRISCCAWEHFHLLSAPASILTVCPCHPACLMLWELLWHVILQHLQSGHLTTLYLCVPLAWYLIIPFHCF